MKSKSLKTQLIAAIVAFILSASVMGASTYAWFASNSKVTATGMEVSAKTVAGLVIDSVHPVTGENPTHSNTATAAKSATKFALYPSHHMFNAEVPSTTSGLIYVTNTSAVSETTGLAADAVNAPLTYAAVDNTNGDYFVDYEVYISAEGAKMTAQDVTATIDSDVVSAVDTPIKNATSIDFYVNNSYKGTLNLAQKDAETNDGSTVKTSVALLSNADIPAYNDEVVANRDGIRITMRVYIDGQLKANATKTYVNTTDATDLTGLSTTVLFTTAPHVVTP